VFQTILNYLWANRTTAFGYVQVALGFMVATQGLFEENTMKWLLFFNGLLTALLGHYNNAQIRKLMAEDLPPKESGFVRVAILLPLALGTLILLVGCTVNPMKEAETSEQKAYALYGVYVISQGKAAALFQDPSVPEKAKQALKIANDRSYPVAEGLVDAANEVSEIRFLLDQCPKAPTPEPECVPTNELRLTNAVKNLSTIYFQAQPILLNLVAAVKGAK
jgi:hypothetical protein